MKPVFTLGVDLLFDWKVGILQALRGKTKQTT